MASTNKTTNYELSQFLGTDKPAWLSDYNSDMGKIDAQMKLNADAATTAGGDAASAVAAVGTLGNLTTDAKTSAVAAINEVDSHADAAQGTASSALASATSASNGVSALQSYLNLNVNNTYSGSQFTVKSGGGSIDSGATLYIARNSDGSVCKIYGAIAVTNATVQTRGAISLPVDTGLRPDSNITVTCTGLVTSNDVIGTSNLNITIKTDGTLEFEGYHHGSSFAYRPLACVIFVKDFGDSQE